ncbi:MAG: P-loop NTPase fold protein [Mycoplasmoidaceae bacterium]
MKEILSNGCYFIDVEGNKDDFNTQCEAFLKFLEEEAKIFNENYKKNRKDFQKKYDNKDIIFLPESVAVASPITIIHGPWGSGKTYFIETLAKNIIDKKITCKYFKKVIMFDALNYLNPNDIPMAIISKLYNVLLKSKDGKVDKKINKGLKTSLDNFFVPAFNKVIIPMINGTLKVAIDKFNDSLESKINDFAKLFDEPILIIIDNIERLNAQAWDVIKFISKLAIIPNFCFVMPMNAYKLQNNDVDLKELRIQRYLNIPVFIFKQNYLSVLLDLGFDDSTAQMLNEILIKENYGNQLSIRELRKSMIRYKTVAAFKESKAKGLANFKEIWNFDEKDLEGW